MSLSTLATWFCQAQPRCWIHPVTTAPSTPVSRKPTKASIAFSRRESPVLAGAGGVVIALILLQVDRVGVRPAAQSLGESSALPPLTPML